MNYEQAIAIIKKQDEVSFSIIEDVVRKMSEVEILELPVVDPHVKLVIQKYAWVFTTNVNHNHNQFWSFYFMGIVLFRDEKPTDFK